MTLNIILQPSGSSSHTLPAHTSITSILFTSPKPCTPTHSLPLTRDLGSWIQVALDELDKLRTLSTWRTHQQMPANVLLSSCRPWWGSCGPDPSYSSQVFADSHLFLVIQSTTIPRNFPTESLTLDTWQQVPPYWVSFYPISIALFPDRSLRPSPHMMIPLFLPPSSQSILIWFLFSSLITKSHDDLAGW